MLNLNEDKSLPLGLHSITADEFLKIFCVDGNREKYKEAIINIFDFAKNKGAIRVIIGGSFIMMNKEEPKDLDCLIVFYNDRQIPTYVDCAQIDNIEYDILYASEETPHTIDTYIKLMKSSVYGIEEKGVIEVRLLDKVSPWEVHYEPNDEDMEVISRVYCDRTIIERNKRRGILVVIHGLNTNAKWLSNLVPTANSQGWIVAPFIYDNPLTLLFDNSERIKVIEQFREFIYKIEQKYDAHEVSIMCHSFGTYIVTKYIEGFHSEKYLPVQIQSLVLTGSIVNPNYDWVPNIPDKVGRVLNIQAEGDDAVKYMPETDWKKLIGMDPLFGRGAIVGINRTSDKVVNRKIEILNHTNIFKDDFIEQVLLPYINANNNIANIESVKKCRENGYKM